jgi:hypothetical protein
LVLRRTLLKDKGSEIMEEKNFDQQFEDALAYIAKNDLILSIENLFQVYVKSEFGSADLFRFIGLLSQLLGNKIGPIMAFFQQPNLNVTVAGIHKPIVTRLIRLKSTYGTLLNDAHIGLSRPFGFQGLAIGGEQGKENYYYHIRRRDGETLSIECIFNESLQICTQLMTALTDKFMAGNNKIDMNLVREFRNVTDKLIGTLEEFEGRVPPVDE